jgi:glucose/arabinose dehydrogenase
VDRRLAPDRSLARRVLGLALIVGLAGCRATATESPAVPDGSVAPTPTAAAPPGSGSPAPPGGSFDPKTVSVALEKVATVDGGPLAFAAPDDGSDRLFVAAKDGRLWALHVDDVQSEPALDLRSLVSSGSEQGLLGVALAPTFPEDPRVFVDYTDVDGNTVVASYVLLAGEATRFDPKSAVWILAVNQPYANHNGGALAFGPDGMLYVSFGDGGSGGDPLGNGQRTDTLLGKILRLDIRKGAGGTGPYAIPADNPFVGVADARPEIWLYGLRNPWRLSFDRATGDMWIGDVGQDAWEEVDIAPAGVGGLNFGWNTMEGNHCFSPREGCSTSGITPPVTEYGHDNGACTVIGGDVYRGTEQPLLVGGYVFADYCSGQMWAIAADADGPRDPVPVGTAGSGIAAFGEDAGGELLAANLDGTISRLVATAR